MRYPLLLALLILAGLYAGTTSNLFTGHPPDIPRTWDSTMVNSVLLPLVDASVNVQPISEDAYYAFPERVIYKTYPLYAPDRMPPGYLDSLRQVEPEVVFDPSDLHTEADWIRAGELVFDYPNGINELDSTMELAFTFAVGGGIWPRIDMPLTRDGVMPFWQFVVREKGTLEIGRFACGMCHTRVQEDGTLIKGAQGNNPFDKERALLEPMLSQRSPNPLQGMRQFEHTLFGAPWIDHTSQDWLDSLTFDQFTETLSAIPPGVLARHGTHPKKPVRIPDLRGIKDHRYLDATGLMQNRSIGDLMRYAAFNADADLFTRFDDFIPLFGQVEGPGPSPSSIPTARFTDEQLYALASYLYSLEPLESPHTYDQATLDRGERVFIEQGCVTCHTPPLYTNNALTPVNGFVVPEDHHERYTVFDISVETDSSLALYTRRGTGYYKVPGLRGLWYRSPLLHDGSLATLEELFDPARLRPDYVPGGFIGAGIEARAVPGHPFGLDLPDEDKAALISFLNTL